MAKATLNADQVIELIGELKFPVITPLRKQVEKLLAGLEGEVKIDFAGVTGVDSSALSFWLCCQRFAQGKNMQLSTLNVPAEMQGIAQLVGLDNLAS